MKFLLLLGMWLSSMSCIATIVVSDTIIVLGELIEEKGGSKIHIATYRVLKVLEGEVSNDTIQIGYYGGQRTTNLPDRARLNIEVYQGKTILKDYYICPNYNLSKGVAKVKIDEVSRAFWLGCETGEGKCPVMELTRPVEGESWYLMMPCGGTQTSILFYEERTNLEDSEIMGNINMHASECPPVLDLTELRDGQYRIAMMSCGLGGTISMKLDTEKVELKR